MKTFKSFIQLDEVERAKYNTASANKMAAVSYLAQTKDPGDLEHVGPEEMGPKNVKTTQGKRKADRLDNKQPFGEELHPQAHQVLKHIKPEHHDKYKPHLQNGTYKHDFADRSAVLKAAQRAGHLKEEAIVEAELSMQQTKMVKNKPEAAQKAYSTIKAKMKEDVDVELLFNLYNKLDENNQEIFLNQLEENVEALLAFAKTITEE